jgi:hypothetical protein
VAKKSKKESWYDAWLTRSNAILTLAVGIVGAAVGAVAFFADVFKPSGSDIKLVFESSGSPSVSFLATNLGRSDGSVRFEAVVIDVVKDRKGPGNMGDPGVSVQPLENPQNTSHLIKPGENVVISVVRSEHFVQEDCMFLTTPLMQMGYPHFEKITSLKEDLEYTEQAMEDTKCSFRGVEVDRFGAHTFDAAVSCNFIPWLSLCMRFALVPPALNVVTPTNQQK